MVEEAKSTQIYALRTTSNREDQVLDFLTSNVEKKKLAVFSIMHPHGMRGYIYVEAASRSDAEQAAQGIPYARGILPRTIEFSEIEKNLEQAPAEMNIKKNDIAEIISGPFKREQGKITRIDTVKGEVVVELLEAAVPIPITLKIDAVKVIRREGEENYTTARDMAYLLEELYYKKFLNKDVSEKSLELLGQQKINDRIPRKLPRGTFVVHKTGLEKYVCHDAGIVYTNKGNFLICVLTKHNGALSKPTKKFISDVTLLTYNYYQDVY
jgi:transcriptional antiterminator NusG